MQRKKRPAVKSTAAAEVKADLLRAQMLEKVKAVLEQEGFTFDDLVAGLVAQGMIRVPGRAGEFRGMQRLADDIEGKRS